MCDHVTIRAWDRAASEIFQGTVLGALAIQPTHQDSAFIELDPDGMNVESVFHDHS